MLAEYAFLLTHIKKVTKADSARWSTAIDLKDVYFYVAVMPWDEMVPCVTFLGSGLQIQHTAFQLLSGCQSFCQGTRVFFYLNNRKIIFGLVSIVNYVPHSTVLKGPQMTHASQPFPQQSTKSGPLEGP